jgi:hypothetical protein
MGATCFTHMVRMTQVLRGFKLPHNHQKYDGSQKPGSWLSDYLQAFKLLGDSKTTTMQSIQLHLSGAATSWLSKLPKGSIGSWDHLTKQFITNFRSTYKKPTSIKEVKACTKKYNESLHSYIQYSSVSLAKKFSDKRAIKFSDCVFRDRMSRCHDRKGHEDKSPGSILCGLVPAQQCALLVFFRILDMKKIPADALGTLKNN